MVSADDYFYPVAGRNRQEEGDNYVTPGEFVVSVNPELKPLGDSITRTLIHRITLIRTILADARKRIAKALVPVKPREKPAFPAERFAKLAQQTEEEFRCLWELCWPQDEGPLREACIILTQIYAAFHISPDLSWLRLSEEILDRGKVDVDRLMKYAQSREMVDYIAKALKALKQLYSEDPPEVLELEAAVLKGGLVLDEASRSIYFHGKKNAHDLRTQHRVWELILALARKARLSQSVSPMDFHDRSGVAITPHALSERIRRTKTMIPADLAKLIERHGERHHYRLNLDRAQIKIVAVRRNGL